MAAIANTKNAFGSNESTTKIFAQVFVCKSKLPPIKTRCESPAVGAAVGLRTPKARLRGFVV